MPSAAVTQTVAAVVRPSTVRACASRRITPAPMKLNSGHDSLNDALDHAAHRVRVLGHGGDLDCRYRDDGSAQRDKPERPRADGPVGKVAVDADYATRKRRCAETKANLDVG